MKMNRSWMNPCVFALLVAGVGAWGCNNKGGDGPPMEPPADAHAHEEGHDHDHGHGHAMTGPHGGSVVELGTETYHAELVHDEASGSVIVYLLDSTIKNPVASDAEEVVINMKHGDAPEQFQLAAQPQVGDPPGKTSRYASTSADLGEELHEEHDSVMLVLTIDGKQYRGAIAHDHDHDGGHDHGHNHADGAGH